MDVRTACLEDSIWRDIPEHTFREHVVLLEERTNAVPLDVQRFAHNAIQVPQNDLYLMSIEDEQRLADAFASIVAVEEGAQSVAAVCLEENVEAGILTVYFAAVDAISDSLQQIMREACKLLAGSTVQASDSRGGIDQLFELITRLHLKRILGRLRSSKWVKPTFLSRSHKKPLWQDFKNLIHRVQFLYTKREASSRRCLELQLEALAKLYASFEDTPPESEEEFSHLLVLIRTSYEYCTSPVLREYAGRLSNAGLTAQVRSALKTLRQIEKIASYYRISNDLICVSRQYPHYFFREPLRMVFLPPYASIPTSIGYEDWAKTCHVHAEIQLIVFHDSRDRPTYVLAPRTIGTSKYLCYLCYLFIKAHPRYSPVNTHGRLYDQWTIPDLSDFSAQQREGYRNIIQRIDEEVMTQTKNPPHWKVEPMTSRENLLDDTSNTVSSTPTCG